MDEADAHADDTLDRLRSAWAESGLTFADVARKSGVDRNTIAGILTRRHTSTPRAGTIAALVLALEPWVADGEPEPLDDVGTLTRFLGYRLRGLPDERRTRLIGEIMRLAVDG